MSKPLELTVYPKRRRTITGINGEPSHYFEYAKHGQLIDEQDIYPSIKHLTEPELAAEFESARCDSMLQDATGSYWSPLGDTWSHDREAVVNRVMTLLRFATAPNYEESDA